MKEKLELKLAKLSSVCNFMINYWRDVLRGKVKCGDGENHWHMKSIIKSV